MNDQSSEFSPDTRARIVEAARELFFQQGYSATGIAQILRHARARSGSLYHFFPSKEDLLAAVLEKYKALLEPRVLAPAFERATDPVERIFAVLDGYRRLLNDTEYQLGCPIGNLALEISNTHPRIRPAVTDNFDAWRAAVRGLIDDASGRMPVDVDAASLATHVLATMEGAVMLTRAYRSMDPFDQAIAHLRDYFERLIQAGSDWPVMPVTSDKEQR